MEIDQVHHIANQFSILKPIQNIETYGHGHIHDTYLVSSTDIDTAYILQKFNQEVFPDPKAVGENIHVVCDHILEKLENLGTQNVHRHVLQPILTQDQTVFLELNGSFWRMFRFIPGTQVIQQVNTEEEAFQAAKAFGAFQGLLVDLSVDRIHDILPGFHDIPKRFRAFEQAIEVGDRKRIEFTQTEIQFAQARKDLGDPVYQALSTRELPLRVTHNDTKINNVLLDKETGEGLCVIDLDTLMPGTILYDFGDMVRTFCSTMPEDSQEIQKVFFRKNIFHALAKGFASETKSMLTDKERSLMVLGGKLITYIMGLRFLTDYLTGDMYYKTSYPEHNIVRCRNQFRLLEEIEKIEPELQVIIEEVF